MFETYTDHDHRHHTTHLTQTLVVQALIVLAVAAIILWAAFFAEYAPLHDAFHALRHALYVIPCH